MLPPIINAFHTLRASADIVGMRLGCINHALLTAEVLEQDACWLQPETPEQREILHAIESRLAAPLLAEMSY